MTRDELIIAHQKDAKRVAGAFWRKGGMQFDVDELEGEALICLVKAASDWDPTRNSGTFEPQRASSAFGPFLVQRIKWHLTRWADLQRGGVRYNNLVRDGKALPVRTVGLTIARQGKNQDEEIERPLPDSQPTVEQDLIHAENDLGALSLDFESKLASVSMTDRERDIISALANAETYDIIATRHHISKQRVGQIAEGLRAKLTAVFKSVPTKIALPFGCLLCGGPVRPGRKWCSRAHALKSHRRRSRRIDPRKLAELQAERKSYKAMAEYFGVTRAAINTAIQRNRLGNKPPEHCIIKGCKKPIRYKRHIFGYLTGTLCKWHDALRQAEYVRKSRARRKTPLTPEQRQERARKASAARWSKPEWVDPVRRSEFAHKVNNAKLSRNPSA